MADIPTKLLIDCSLPVDHPNHTQVVELDADELKQLEVDAAAMPARKLEKIKGNRDIALSESDWTQLPDAPLTDVEKQQWADYRQQLRDLPAEIPLDETISEVTLPAAPDTIGE